MARLSDLFGILFASLVGYLAFLGALTVPLLQHQVIYLNRVTLTWFKDVNVPEQWGFLRNQVTPFFIRTPDGESLHAWHVLPLELYRRHERDLLDENAGLVSDITSRVGYKLLRDDPEALLVIYLHGAAGTLGSGWRPPSYRALYAGAPDKIHTVAIDYRGYGISSGTPSEDGLLIDALALADWAMNVAGIPPSRIVLFGQSLGTAVSIALARHMALESPSICFAGMVLVAPFADVQSLTATYRLGGTIPILSPVAYFPKILSFFNTFIISKWPSTKNIADFVRSHQSSDGLNAEYHITIIHAEDDYDIPWSHSEALYWHAVSASTPGGISYEALEREKSSTRKSLGAGGWVVERQTDHGMIREEIIKYGMHDITMSYPVVSLAVSRAFHSTSVNT